MQNLLQSWRFLGRYVLVLVACSWLVSDVAAGEPTPPITTDTSKVGELLRAWEAEGTAAGNVGDWYDNRDREHSGLNLAPWPQLRKVAYTDEERQRRADWGIQSRVLPFVVFGNSSTASGVGHGGSNTRELYTHPVGLQLLHAQYRQHNLYIYPEHVDHDPGHNGTPGYGDLYPTNTPYLLTSQGSSGSDQPFMRAMPFLLAAFRPEVKEKLMVTGTLMPTIQMLFRTCNKHLADPGEYLTGKAHPTVFDGRWVDVQNMVRMAHDMTLKTLPPVVHIKVIEEDEPRNGRDFFDAPAFPAEVLAQRYPGSEFAQRNLEQHADTPAVIARIRRGRNFLRRIVVSAAESVDLNQRPLTFHWVVLRGDAETIRLRRLDAAGTQVEIVVPYTGRGPVLPGSALQSNRVDIGVFVHNGVYYSAPAFVTFFSLDNEARTYDAQGRILEIGYGMGETVVKVTDWQRLFTWLEPQADGPMAQLMQSLFPSEVRERLLQAAPAYLHAKEIEAMAAEKRQAAEARHSRHAGELKAAEQARTAAAQAHQKAPGPTTETHLAQATQALATAQQAARETETVARLARLAHDAARRAAAEVPAKPEEGERISVKTYVEQVLQELVRQPRLLGLQEQHLQPLWDAASSQTRAAPEAERRALALWGVVRDSPGLGLQLTPLQEGSAPVEERLTRFEKALLARFHAVFLSQVAFPNVVSFTFTPNYVDPQLTAAKFWRDVYRYDATGGSTGWTRFDGQQRIEFNAEGLRVEARDTAGRYVQARTVLYQREAPSKTREGDDLFPNLKPLRMTLGPEFVYYTYDGASDTQGRELKREPATAAPTIRDTPPVGR